MKKNRRDFLRMTGAMALSASVLPVACKSAKSEPSDSPPEEVTGNFEQFGIQLYTMREILPEDIRGVLREVAAVGYKQVESYEGNDGMFWRMKPGEFKKYLADLGMDLVASHCKIEEDFEKKVEQAASIGMKYLVCPYKGPQPTLDHFKKFAEEFNRCGEICKNAGLRFAYHNHAYGFIPLEGQLPQEVMMNATDPDLVDFELDIYWIVTGGKDPEEWLKKYKDRFRLCHIKDRRKNPVKYNSQNSVDLGTGSIDFSKVLRTARDNGMQYFLVEQETYNNGLVMDSVRANAEFMKKLRI